MMVLNFRLEIFIIRNEASLEEWGELYDVAIRVKEMKLWEEL